MRTRSQMRNQKVTSPIKKTKKQLLKEKKAKQEAQKMNRQRKKNQISPLKNSLKQKQPIAKGKKAQKAQKAQKLSQKDKKPQANDHSVDDKKNSGQNNKKQNNKQKNRVLRSDSLTKSEVNLDKNVKKNKGKKKQQALPQQKKQDKEEKLDQVKKDQEEEKIMKVTMTKGVAPIDAHFSGPKNVHVLVHNGIIYHTTMNQTNTKNNNNKFYILQILQSEANSNVCYFFTRWGRVGFDGQHTCMGPYNIDYAIHEYNQKLKDKHKKGDYRIVDINFEDQEQDDKNEKPDNKNANDPQKQSKLKKPVKQLMELMFDMKMMNRQLIQIGYNVKKMPLGKLSKNSIQKGYEILKELLNQIEHQNRSDLVRKLTDDFYSYIPHDFGMQKMQNFVLKTSQKVKQKLELLETLSDIKIATTIINDESSGQNKIDSNYQKLKRTITHIEKNSAEYDIIHQYLQTTHASSHGSYQLELVDLFGIDDQRENARFTKHIGNNMLLWHGSRLTNFVGILSQGLRIAPPQAPVTGYMFGKGVYFADMSSKSANYCFTNRDNNIGILLLCEVALGETNDKYHADYYASNLPPGKHSTKGLGRIAPPESKYQRLKNIIVPMGPGESTNLPACTLMYNEFIVYDIAQIRIKYLLRINFRYK